MDLEGLGGEVSFRDKVLWVFVSPSHCFEALKERPDWLKAWLLVAAIGLLPGIVLLNTVDLRPIAAEAVDKVEAAKAEAEKDHVPMSEQERDSAIDQFVKFQWVMATAGSAMMSFIRLFVAAGAIYVLARAFAIAPAFPEALSVWAYASIVRIPEVLLIVAASVATKGKGFNLESLFGEWAVTPIWQLVISQFDPFSIWQLVVAALGLSLVCGARKAKGFGVMAAMWALWWGLGIWNLTHPTVPPAGG